MKKLTHKLKLTVAGLCALALASVAGYACSMDPFPFSGTGVFGSTQKDQREMGAVQPYLAGVGSLNMVLILTDYTASCQPLAYVFMATTPAGYQVSGVAEPAGGKSRQRGSGSSKVNLKVTYLEVIDPLLPAPVTDDGGFKLEFTTDPRGA